MTCAPTLSSQPTLSPKIKGESIRSIPSSTSLGFLQIIFKDCFGILSINRKILLENKFYYREGVALRMNQSFAFEFLCENFQPKLINSYSNFKRFFHFLLCDLGSDKTRKVICQQSTRLFRLLNTRGRLTTEGIDTVFENVYTRIKKITIILQ